MKTSTCIDAGASRPMKPLLAIASPFAGQAAEPAFPSAGTILRQVQPITPAVPSSRGTGLTIESSMSPQLRRVLSKASFEQVRDDIENLQFDDAVRVLEASHLEDSLTP